MRTTITLAPDVAAAISELSRDRQSGVSDVVNDLLRRGLASGEQGLSFRQDRSDMGAPLLPSEDVSALLDILEGDDRRG